MIVSFHGSFLMILILLTSINSSTLAQPSNAIITDELIHRICYQTRNPILCLNNLKSSKGKSLLPNSLAAIGSDTMNMALSHANRTADLIWRRYSGTTVDKREIRLRYHKCFMIYSLDVIDRLTQANKYMLAGAARSVKNCISAAVNQVNFCNKELMKPPREQSGIILESNNMFKDLSSIILAICNKVPK